MIAVVRGIGACVPPKVVTNEHIASVLDVDTQWIFQRTGIKSRRVVDGDISTLDLAVKAGARAIESSALHSIDLVLVATTSPERLCPAVAPEVANTLGLRGVAAYDISAACSGFVYGLATAKSYIECGIAETILLIGSEAFTKFVNTTDPDTYPIFGDGAGALVIQKGDTGEPGAIGGFDLGSDGALSDALCTPAGGARQRVRDSAGKCAQPADYYLSMEGGTVYENAVARMADSAAAALEKNKMDITKINWMIGHQANIRILQTVAYTLNFPEEKIASNIIDHGNTLAASIPLLLNDYTQRGLLKPGDNLLVSAFGAGFSWGSTVISWPALSSLLKEWD